MLSFCHMALLMSIKDSFLFQFCFKENLHRSPEAPMQAVRMRAVVILLLALSGMNQNHAERHQCRSRYADEHKVRSRPVLITGDHNCRRHFRRFGRDLYGLLRVIDVLMHRYQVSLQVVKLLEYDKRLSLQTVGI